MTITSTRAQPENRARTAPAAPGSQGPAGTVGLPDPSCRKTHDRTCVRRGFGDPSCTVPGTGSGFGGQRQNPTGHRMPPGLIQKRPDPDTGCVPDRMKGGSAVRVRSGPFFTEPSSRSTMIRIGSCRPAESAGRRHHARLSRWRRQYLVATYAPRTGGPALCLPAVPSTVCRRRHRDVRAGFGHRHHGAKRPDPRGCGGADKIPECGVLPFQAGHSRGDGIVCGVEGTRERGARYRNGSPVRDAPARVCAGDRIRRISPSTRITEVVGDPGGGGDATACVEQITGEPTGAAPHNNKTCFYRGVVSFRGTATRS